MIFIVLGNTSLPGFRITAETHYNWCKELGKYRNVPFTAFNFELSETGFMNLEKVLNSSGNKNEDIFILINAHCNHDKNRNVELLQLQNGQQYLDEYFCEFFHKNKVNHVTVWLECCHSAGLFDFGTKFFINEHDEKKIRHNVLFFCTSQIQEESLQLVQQGAYATWLLKENFYNPYMHRPFEVMNFLNSHKNAKIEQNACYMSLLDSF